MPTVGRVVGTRWQLLPAVVDPWGQRQPFYPRSGKMAYAEAAAQVQRGPFADAGDRTGR